MPMAASPPFSEPKLPGADQPYSHLDHVMKAQRKKKTDAERDAVARKLFDSPRGQEPPASGGSDEVEQRLHTLDELAQQLEQELREQRAARQGVEELLDVERALAASAAEVHAQELQDERRGNAEERGARQRAEAALASSLSERALQRSQLNEAQSTAQRWEAECGRVAAQSEVELAKFRARQDQDVCRRGDQADQLREALRECEDDRLNAARHASAALEQAATEHDALQQALAAKIAQCETQQSELVKANAAKAGAEDLAATAQAGVEAAHEELKERIAFERGERIKLERKNEKLSKALRLERTRRAGCPVCRRNYCGDDKEAVVTPAESPGAGANPQHQHHLTPTTLSEAEARRVLGVALDASIAEVKAAYRQCVLASHPDKNPQSAAVRFLLLRQF